jgi:hypothetical protein
MENDDQELLKLWRRNEGKTTVALVSTIVIAVALQFVIPYITFTVVVILTILEYFFLILYTFRLRKESEKLEIVASQQVS